MSIPFGPKESPEVIDSFGIALHILAAMSPLELTPERYSRWRRLARTFRKPGDLVAAVMTDFRYHSRCIREGVELVMSSPECCCILAGDPEP
ncbi:hypothetical protein [Glaciibacter psychrotolerans]|uniref:Uncharacterized protein n=1 Tax=Glaciibacter psychrotolerans TaxID=670054 RepID=A0A7Z0EDG3_9MICO|nr:hypothetical protein [Leifsonia psychrotolerans]NYJ19617.1 hypothetical protein [Leifsonia psychrotolerans]